MCPRVDLTVPTPEHERQCVSATCCQPGAAARAAVLLPRHGQRVLASANRRFERDRNRLMEVGAPDGVCVLAPRVPLIQHVGEEIAEGRGRRPAYAGRKVEPLESVGRRLDRRGGGAGRVVAAPAIGIDQRLVGFRDLTELRLRQPIARVDVRVVPPGKALVGALDLAEAGRPFQAEENVEIHV